MNKEFEKWFFSWHRENLHINYEGNPSCDIREAFLAGQAAQKKRDAEIARGKDCDCQDACCCKDHGEAIAKDIETDKE